MGEIDPGVHQRDAHAAAGAGEHRGRGADPPHAGRDHLRGLLPRVSPAYNSASPGWACKGDDSIGSAALELASGRRGRAKRSTRPGEHWMEGKRTVSE